MAADVKAPRMERARTNMEEAAAAASLRSKQDGFAAKFEAWDRAWKAREEYDAQNRPVDSSGLTPEAKAYEDGRERLDDACAIAATALLACPAPDGAAVRIKQRVFYAEEFHLCADSAAAAIGTLFEDAARLSIGAEAVGATAFGIHADAYWTARTSYEAVLAEHGVDADGFDEAASPLISAMHEAAVAAVKCPASSTHEIFRKLELFLNEELYLNGDHAAVRGLIECVSRDAARIGGAA